MSKRRSHIKRAKIMRCRCMAYQCQWPMPDRWFVKTGRLWQALRGYRQD